MLKTCPEIFSFVRSIYLNNIGNREVCLVSHKANDGEDDEASEDAGGTVGEGDEDGVPVAVVGELIVAGQSDQTTETGAQRIENLGGSVSPHLEENKTVFIKLEGVCLKSCLDIL